MQVLARQYGIFSIFKGMKAYKSLMALPLLALFALTTSACNDEKPVAKIIVVDKKMPLAEWPDSIYVNSLDSILALEPIKKPKKGEKDANLVLNPHQAPVFKLPNSATGKNAPKKPNTDAIQRRLEADKQARESGKVPTGREDNASGKKAEAFGDKFVRAMSDLQSDPNNSSLYKIVTANDENLNKFLRRTYGAGSSTLPLFFVKTSLQTINPGIDFDNLKAGDKVKVPRL